MALGWVKVVGKKKKRAKHMKKQRQNAEFHS